MVVADTGAWAPDLLLRTHVCDHPAGSIDFAMDRLSGELILFNDVSTGKMLTVLRSLIEHASAPASELSVSFIINTVAEDLRDFADLTEVMLEIAERVLQALLADGWERT